jgi:fumarylacetoacetase
VTLSSWVPGADGSGYGPEHLPYGVITTAADGRPRPAARIGDHALDLARLAAAGTGGLGPWAGPLGQPVLNPFLAAGPGAWADVRARVTELVCSPSARAAVEPALLPLGAVTLHLPVDVADYVDFYSSIEHATNLGRLFRPDAEPLLPNWRHLPVGYHGRSGSVVVSGTPVVRPSGQRRVGDEVVFGPSVRLDIELEVGFVVGVPSELGVPVPVAEAPGHVFGVVLVNDWSARDIQAWEYQPLGPFLGKSFATSISAWVTPLAALEGCRVAGATQEPAPLPHLARAEPWGLDLDLFVDMWPGPADPTTVSTTSFADIYWQFPQQIAHLTSNGASLRTGDLLASGTVSGPERGSEGSLLELTGGGREPLRLTGAGRDVERTFLQASDGIRLRGSATVAPGVTLTLGEVTGRIVGG